MKPKAADRHGWNSLDHYLAIHDAQLQRLGAFFVEDDCSQIYLTDEGTLRIEGLIWCKGNIFLDVTKTLELNERDQVRTVLYKYHAGIELNGETRSIFRYDNAHVYSREGHADAHHKHRYNHDSWEEIHPPDHLNPMATIVGRHWPTSSKNCMTGGRKPANSFRLRRATRLLATHLDTRRIGGRVWASVIARWVAATRQANGAGGRRSRRWRQRCARDGSTSCGPRGWPGRRRCTHAPVRSSPMG